MLVRPVAASHLCSTWWVPLGNSAPCWDRREHGSWCRHSGGWRWSFVSNFCNWGTSHWCCCCCSETVFILKKIIYQAKTAQGETGTSNRGFNFGWFRRRLRLFGNRSCVDLPAFLFYPFLCLADVLHCEFFIFALRWFTEIAVWFWKRNQLPFYQHQKGSRR